MKYEILCFTFLLLNTNLPNCIMEILPQINEQQTTEMFFHN